MANNSCCNDGGCANCIKKWIVKRPCGTEYDLMELGYRVSDYDGIAMPTIQIYSNDLPQRDGVSFLGTRYNARDWLVKIIIDAEKCSYHQARRDLMRMFAPDCVQSTMCVVFPDQSEFEIDFTVNGNFLGSNGRIDGTFGIVHTTVIPLFSANPIWRDPHKVNKTFWPLRNADGTGLAGMPVRTPVETPIGESLACVTNVHCVDYEGSYAAKPIVRIFGPIKESMFANVTTKQSVSFPDLTIAEGDYIQIDFSTGIITDQDGNFADNYLDEDSDLGAFSVVANGDYNIRNGACYSGQNCFALTGSGMTTETSFQMEYYNLFFGI